MTQLRRCTKGKYCMAGREDGKAILQPMSEFYNGGTRILKNCQTCRDYNKKHAATYKKRNQATKKQPPSEAERQRYREWLRDIRKPRAEKPREIKPYKAGRL